jgi:FixJ family two-component response regulator
VVVITATPHWRIARALFRAGAADYVRKSQNRQEIRENVLHLLE